MISKSGLYFEDFVANDHYRHSVTRSVTDLDNLLFSVLSMNTQPLHLDREFAKHSIAGEILANSIYTIGLVCGIAMGALMARTMFADLGFQSIETPNIVRLGDTIRAETEILSARLSSSRPDVGIVGLRHLGYNQRNEEIARAEQFALIYRRRADD
jgi:acyl dehydratase